MSDLSVGSTVAGCRLEAVAGRGGMGVVYRATQLALDRPVAVKAIAPQLAEDPSFRERFQHESQIAASIDHPNVIPVYEAGELDGTLYLIMRWVEGTDLRALLRSEGRLAPDRAIRLLRPVASAMAAAHRRGLVHRDIKPANVLISRGEGDDEHVYLTDFGIARRIDGDAAMTRTGVLVGTLDYTAPERIEGGRGDAASDIYSFGCMLFEALTGAVPFDRPTELAKMHAHMNDAPPSARAAIAGVPTRLDAVVTRAMAKDPADRFVTAADLASALERALDEVETDEVASARLSARATAETDETDLPDVAPPGPTEPIEPTSETLHIAAARTTPDLRPSAPTPARSRRPAGLVLAGVVVAVVAVVAAVSGGGGGSKTVRTSTRPRTTPARAAAPVASGSATVRPAAVFRVPGPPAGAAVARGVLWVAVPARARIVGFVEGDPTTTVTVGGRPDRVAADRRQRLWVTHTGPRQVTVFDPATKRSVAVPTGTAPGGIAMTSTAAWVANTGERSLTRIDLKTLVPKQLALPAKPTAIVAAFGRIWVGTAGGRVSVFDDDGHVDDTGGPALAGDAVAGAFNHGVWLLGPGAGGTAALTRIDPRKPLAHRVGGRRQYATPAPPPAVAGPPADVVAAGDSIWVGAGRALTRIGTAGAGGTLGKVTFPSPVGRLAVDGNVIWVLAPATERVYRVAF